MPKFSLILNYPNNSIQFYPGYLPDGKAKHLGGNAPTQNLALLRFGWELKIFGGKIPMKTINFNIWSTMSCYCEGATIFVASPFTG